MMDRLDDAAIGRIRDGIAARTRSLLPDPIDRVLFDCTPLFFPSPCADTLRAFGDSGYSQDGKHGAVPVLLASAGPAR